MIDHTQRRQMAELLRHFAAGVMTMDTWEERSEKLLARDDPALSTIWTFVWGKYDDFRTERLRGKWRLNGEERQAVARCILFLYGETIYQWHSPGCCESLISLLTFGLWNRQYDAGGEESCWPFYTCEELNRAKQKLRFFSNKSDSGKRISSAGRSAEGYTGR